LGAHILKIGDGIIMCEILGIYISAVAFAMYLLFNLSISPRFEKSRVVLLPIICGVVMVGWSICSIFFLRGDESSNFHNLSPMIFLNVTSLIGPIAFLDGCGIGFLLYQGSKLWQNRKMVNSKILIVFDFVLFVVSGPAIFFILGLWATG
jgi:hypothetical protein